MSKDIKSQFTDFGKSILEDRYLHPEMDETVDDILVRVSKTYAENDEHQKRMLGYLQKFWFMPATPILSNGGTDRGLPISCFLNNVNDSIVSIFEKNTENALISKNGGGIGTNWSDLRAVNSPVSGGKGKSGGVIPFLRNMESTVTSVSQGGIRRGSGAAYLHVSHPEIVEFIDIRKPSGDLNRKCLNLHHGVIIPDSFMEAVKSDSAWDLICPKSGTVIETLQARTLWAKIIKARLETGEPYMLFIDTVIRSTPEHHKILGLYPQQSNLC